MQYYEKTEHISKKDKFEYWGQQIACYKYFFRRGNETNFYLATYPPLRLNILFVKTSFKTYTSTKETASKNILDNTNVVPIPAEVTVRTNVL